MSEYVSCISCKTPLYIDHLSTDMDIDSIGVLYCPNDGCPRFQLHTVEPESDDDAPEPSSRDKIKGGK